MSACMHRQSVRLSPACLEVLPSINFSACLLVCSAIYMIRVVEAVVLENGVFAPLPKTGGFDENQRKFW